jgi:hypothetical protein
VNSPNGIRKRTKLVRSNQEPCKHSWSKITHANAKHKRLSVPRQKKIAHKQTSTALSEFIQKERTLEGTTDLSEALDSSTDMPEGALNSLVGKIARKAVNRESTQRH